jgi:hypothetical protein
MAYYFYEDYVDEAIANDVEEAAWEDSFVWDLLKKEYVDEDITKDKLAVMFKAYCRYRNNTKIAKENSEKDLLIMTKSLMEDMYKSAFNIVNERNV